MEMVFQINYTLVSEISPDQWIIAFIIGASSGIIGALIGGKLSQRQKLLNERLEVYIRILGWINEDVSIFTRTCNNISMLLKKDEGITQIKNRIKGEIEGFEKIRDTKKSERREVIPNILAHVQLVSKKANKRIINTLLDGGLIALLDLQKLLFMDDIESIKNTLEHETNNTSRDRYALINIMRKDLGLFRYKLKY